MKAGIKVADRYRRVTRLTAAFLGLVCALLAGACSSGQAQLPEGAPDAAGTSDLPAATFADVFRGDQLGLVDFAVRKLRNQCLADSGYSANLAGMDTEPSRMFGNLVISLSTFRMPESEEAARRRGFGYDIPAQPGRLVSFDAAYDRELSRCEAAAAAEIGPEYSDVNRNYIELGNTISAEFQSEYLTAMGEGYQEMSGSLLRCLTARGYQAADPQGFVKEPEVKAFGIQLGRHEGASDTWAPQQRPGTIQVGPPTPARRYIPTQEESDLAVAWYKCMDETGGAMKLMSWAATAQQIVIDRHEVSFAELNPRLDLLARSAARLVGK